jgi:hypothetical protein
VDVPGALGGGVEGIGAKYLAEGGDDQGVVMGELVADLGDPGRLTQGEVIGVGELGDGCAGRAAPPAFPGIRLRDDEPHFVGRGDQTSQDLRREDRGTCEGYLQGDLSALLGEQVLPPLAHGGLARLPVGAVEDQDAVEVVNLVLEDPGEQAGSFEA